MGAPKTDIGERRLDVQHLTTTTPIFSPLLSNPLSRMESSPWVLYLSPSFWSFLNHIFLVLSLHRSRFLGIILGRYSGSSVTIEFLLHVYWKWKGIAGSGSNTDGLFTVLSVSTFPKYHSSFSFCPVLYWQDPCFSGGWVLDGFLSHRESCWLERVWDSLPNALKLTLRVHSCF